MLTSSSVCLSRLFFVSNPTEIAWLLKQTIKGEMKQKKALLLSQRNKAKVEDSK